MREKKRPRISVVMLLSCLLIRTTKNEWILFSEGNLLKGTPVCNLHVPKIRIFFL